MPTVSAARRRRFAYGLLIVALFVAFGAVGRAATGTNEQVETNRVNAEVLCAQSQRQWDVDLEQSRILTRPSKVTPAATGDKAIEAQVAAANVRRVAQRTALRIAQGARPTCPTKGKP